MPAPRRGRKRPQLDDVVLPRASDSFTLEFEVCNGFTNQRIALLSGLVLATEANRSVVLPDFLLNGMQPDGIEMVTANQADTVPFGTWFDEQAFAEAVAPFGVQVVAGKAPGATPVPIKVFDSQSRPNAFVTYLRKHRSHQHISIGCPAFRLPAALMKQHQELLQAATEGLLPSQRFQSLIAARRQRVADRTGSTAYNLIHLRVEKDWFALCKWWQKPDEGRDNCMNNTDTVGDMLQLYGFQTKIPVIVVTSFPDAVPEALETALQSITSRQYTVVLGSALVQPGEELTREESALVDYYLGLHAQKFTGNSVSTFTAFIILERQWLGRYPAALWLFCRLHSQSVINDVLICRQSLHYNGGNVPLQIFFPFYASGSD
ncbi:O-fucosyltransferase 23 [Chlorella vulgaris]